MRNTGSLNTTMFTKTWLQDNEVAEVVFNKAIADNLIESFSPEQVMDEIQKAETLKEENPEEFEKAAKDLSKLQKKTVVGKDGHNKTVYVKTKERKETEEVEKDIQGTEEIAKSETNELQTIEEIETFFKGVEDSLTKKEE